MYNYICIVLGRNREDPHVGVVMKDQLTVSMHTVVSENMIETRQFLDKI